MRCIDPTLVSFNDKGDRIFRSFSLIKHNAVFLKIAHYVLDCGKCIMCRKKKAYELACRCVLHASMYKENCFLTLTYDEKKPNYHNNFEYKDIQDFKKRLRSYCKRKYDKKIEIFNVHEYGEKGKKHWHLVVFNHDFEDKKLFTVHNNINIYTSEKLSELWDYGFNTIGDVTQASAMYQAQYMEKDYKNGYVTTRKKSHSKHSGIGKPYFLKHYRQILLLGYVPVNGGKMPLPRYFERIAHKHYSHFYEKQNFFDNDQRQALYRPFKIGEENLEIADLYISYKEQKKLKIKELEKEWQESMERFLTTKETPDFIKSGKNFLHDLKNKPSNKEKF